VILVFDLLNTPIRPTRCPGKKVHANLKAASLFSTYNPVRDKQTKRRTDVWTRRTRRPI